MFMIDSIAKIIVMSIGSLGVLFLISCIIDLIRLKTAQRVTGTIIDCVQEFTSRGFLWKTKVSYTYNDQQRFCILRARSTKRESGDVSLRVTKDGKIIEINHLVEKCLFGVLALTITFILMGYFC
jgi:hypothetical protein